MNTGIGSPTSPKNFHNHRHVWLLFLDLLFYFIVLMLTSAIGPRAFCSSGPASCNSVPAVAWVSSLTVAQFTTGVSSRRTCSDLVGCFYV